MDIIGYQLAPITKENFTGMQTCSTTSCCITGLTIHGSGSRKDIIHPSVFKFLLTDKYIQSLIKTEMLGGRL